MTRYIPSKSSLQTGTSGGNGLLGTLAVVGCSAAIFMAGVFWLKDMGGTSAIADLVEHATGTYDWMHAPTNAGHWSEAYPMHKVIPDHGHIAGVDVPTDEGMPQMHGHIMQDMPGVALQPPGIGSQAAHSPQAFQHPEDWNIDYHALNEGITRTTGVSHVSSPIDPPIPADPAIEHMEARYNQLQKIKLEQQLSDPTLFQKLTAPVDQAIGKVGWFAIYGASRIMDSIFK